MGRLLGRSASSWLSLIAVPTLIFGLLYAVPIGNLVNLRFTPGDGAAATGSAYTLSTYVDLLSDEFVREVFLRTIRISLITTIAAAIVGYPISVYILSVVGWRQTAMFILLLLPLMTSVTVTTYGWLILLGHGGAVNNLLMNLGLIDAPLRIIKTEWAIVVGLVYTLSAFMVISIAASLQSIDQNHVRAARSLGASPAKAFWRIVFPQSLPGLRTGCLLVFSLSMSSYATPIILGGQTNKFASLLVYQQAINLLNWPKAASLAVLLLLTTTGCLVLASGLSRVWASARRLNATDVPIGSSGPAQASSVVS